jgi:P4 family phage/plasmid primase-like protien
VSGFFVVDIDGDEGMQQWRVIADQHEPVTTLTAITGGGGMHLLFAWVDALSIGNRAGILPGVDVRGQGGYIVAPPSVHPNGTSYRWQDESAEIAQPPLWLLELLIGEKRGRVSPPPPTAPTLVSSSNGHSKYAAAALRSAIDRIRSAVNGTRNETLNREGFAMSAFVRDGYLDRGTVEYELRSAAQAVGLSDSEIDKTLRSAMNAGLTRSNRVIALNAPGAPNTNGHSANGHAAPAQPPAAAPAGQGNKSRIPTDDELAERWLGEHPGTRYGIGEFRRYGTGLWPTLTQEQVDAELYGVLQHAKGEGIRPTSGRMDSVRVMARALTAKHVSEWDADPDLLVCGNGTLHIPTMELKAHDAEHYQTSGVAFDYDATATAPTFEMVLRQTVPDAAAFIQEFAGYALTTDTRYEICLWFAGPPGSGKSTVIEGLRAMLGSRCGLLGLADLERNTFALTNVPGKTLLISTEQPGGYMQVTHILNQLVSGETISVNRKYRDPVDVVPRAKLAWAMNDLPRVADSNDGLFRRVKIVKFPALSGMPNPAIKERVKAEGAGVLNWALAGLQRLRERGRFDIPQCVAEAVDQFKQTNDVPAMFVSECCIVAPDKFAGSTSLYEAYKTWAISNGHKPQSSTSIATDWRRFGFERRRQGFGNVWQGVGLLADAGRL